MANDNGRITVLVTGGARRIGRAIALEAARRGCAVVIAYRRSAAEARRTVREIEGAGVRGLAVRMDQGRPASIRRAFRRLKRRGVRLDLLVNNAAVFERTALGRTTPAAWDRVLDTNLRGPYFVVQEALPLLRRGGAIVNVADVGGIVPWPGYAAYAASKAGLIMLTRVLARALAPRLRVNAIAPGTILPARGIRASAWRRAVGKTILRRAGAPEDVAKAVFFCAENRFMTGQTLLVDGGRHLWF